MATLRESIASLKSRHIEYIESTYHVRHPQIIRERRSILDDIGGVVSDPWIEATPVYEPGPMLTRMAVPPEAKDLLRRMHEQGLGVFDPLYSHQVRALESFFRKEDPKELVVSTGTGSGKTEIFLYSILGSLAAEGARGKTSQIRGLRALILYPMNALVSDQLSRLRRTLGDESSAAILKAAFGRLVQFGMYTSRTPYHGLYDPEKNDRYVRPLVKYFVEMGGDPDRRSLLGALRGRGRVPQKDLTRFLGDRNAPRASKYHTQPGDRELLTRQEMHSPNEYGGTPDVLVTNYSMLEYMLLRPIEQPLFESTQRWLAADPENQLLVVIDEAHLYRGAQGAEVALLIRRLLQHLGIKRDRVRCILTSASLGSKKTSEATGKSFASRLTGGNPSAFEVILADPISLGGKPPLPTQLGIALQSVTSDLDPSSLGGLATYFGWREPVPQDGTTLRRRLGRELSTRSEFRTLHDSLTGRPRRVSEVASELFPGLDPKEQVAAVLNLSLLATASLTENDAPLLPVRIHLMFRGLPKLYSCVNRRCPGRRVQDAPQLLGALFMNPRLSCDHCGARVFELMGHRTCGAIYLSGYFRKDETSFPRFLWTQDEAGGELQEVHLLVEEPRSDPDPTEEENEVPLNQRIAPRYLDTLTGYLLDEVPSGEEARFLTCWWPPTATKPSRGRNRGGPPTRASDQAELAGPLTWRRCFACGIDERRAKRPSWIMDHETRGEEPFANIVKTMFMVQPPARETGSSTDSLLPNKGRKVLCFSDGRQKAARLARDLQRTVEQDSFRELVMLSAHEAGVDSPLDSIFPNVLAIALRTHIGLFDDGDGREGGDYAGSRSRFLEAQKDFPGMMTELGYKQERDLLADEWARKEINGKKPRQFDQQLLRVLGDRNFSIRQSMVGYVAPLPATLRAIQNLNSPTDPELVRNIVLAIIDYALQERAIDPDIREEDRFLSRRSGGLPKGYPRGEGEGLTLDDLLPTEIKHALAGLDPDAVQRLRIALRRGGPSREPPLFLPRDGRFWLNPSAVTLKVHAQADWNRCSGCGRFSPFEFSGRCPDYKCQGAMERIPVDDLYVRTRKDFLRTPVLEVLGLKSPKRDPFTIRSEEHTAQLTAKDSSGVFGRAERYELLFQDILVDDLKHQQPVDVLSCTTTMEVGIDIGSLTAVALRTVPPRPDNYQQRSGRAGRRGAALSIIATFADNSPHESYVFENPARIIGVESSPPTIYVENLKITERHLNASLIQAFFQRQTGALLEQDAQKRSVFESLGTAQSFFSGEGPYSLKAFVMWIHEEIEGNAHSTADAIGEIIPPEVRSGLVSGNGPTWRSELVLHAASALVERLLAYRDRVNWNVPRDEEDNLLSSLLDAGFLPTFSFPLDVCAFVVRDFDRRGGSGKSGAVVNRYEMSQDLSQALSEYIPGREIVVDKHTFISYGLYFPFTTDPVNRARVVDWDNLRWLNWCRVCGITLEETAENLQKKGTKCIRNHEIESIPRYRPEGFAPEVNQGFGAVEGGDRATERIYATQAEFPAPVEATPPKGSTVLSVSEVAKVRSLPNQQLVVRNFGPDQSGFTVCRDCGAVSVEGTFGVPHNRPYQLEFWNVKGAKGRQCSGAPVIVAFAHDFLTDLAILSVRAQSPLNFGINQEWFRAAARSLSEALVLGATRALGIDPAELAGNWREVAKYLGDPDSVRGHVEFFLYDTTPGGAGFAAEAARRFKEVLAAARRILADCDCDTSCHKCIRTYDNKFYHNSLTRIGALTLLDYAETGKVPTLLPARVGTLIDQLSRALSLVDGGAFQNRSSAGTLRVSRGARSVELLVQSVFYEVAPPMTPGPKPPKGAKAPLEPMSFTDYAIEHRLPWVVGEIIDAIRP